MCCGFVFDLVSLRKKEIFYTSRPLFGGLIFVYTKKKISRGPERSFLSAIEIDKPFSELFYGVFFILWILLEVRGDISRDTDFSRDIFSLADGLKEVFK